MKMIVVFLCLIPSFLFSQSDKEIINLTKELDNVKRQIEILDFSVQQLQRDSVPVAILMQLNELKLRLNKIVEKLNENSSQIERIRQKLDDNFYQMNRLKNERSTAVSFGISLVFPGLGAFYCNYNVTGVVEILIDLLAAYYYTQKPTNENLQLAVGIHLAQAVLNAGLASHIK